MFMYKSYYYDILNLNIKCKFFFFRYSVMCEKERANISADRYKILKIAMMNSLA